MPIISEKIVGNYRYVLGKYNDYAPGSKTHWCEASIYRYMVEQPKHKPYGDHGCTGFTNYETLDKAKAAFENSGKD